MVGIQYFTLVNFQKSIYLVSFYVRSFKCKGAPADAIHQ